MSEFIDHVELSESQEADIREGGVIWIHDNGTAQDIKIDAKAATKLYDFLLRHSEQETSDYWRGYNKAQEEYKIQLEEALQDSSERLDELTASIAVLRETMDASIRHLASHISHLALQISLDHRQNEEHS